MSEYPDYILRAYEAQQDALMEIAGIVSNPDTRDKAIEQMKALLDLSKKTNKTILRFKKEIGKDKNDKLAFMKSVLLDIKNIDDYNLDDL
jgi:hypothetical protein